MINKAIILGTIQKKEIKTDKNGKKVCMLSITTNKRYLDSDGKEQEVITWHNAHFFNHLAENAIQNANVKNIIYLEGEMSNKKIDDRIVQYIKGSLIKIVKPNDENK